MRVFIGFTEIANFVQSYQDGFRDLGHSTLTLIARKNNYYPNNNYDVIIEDRLTKANIRPRILLKLIHSLQARFWSILTFIRALVTCDLFYYNTGGTILPFALDYKLIKLLRKKLVIIYLGSEIRHWRLYQKEMESMGYAELFSECIETYKTQGYGTLREMKSRVSIAEKHADLILSQPGFAQLQRRPYMRVTVGLRMQNYKCMIAGRSKPLIVHAPSSRGVKGTEYVIEALDKLKQEGVEFDFKLIENMPNHELIQLLMQADIVVDELNSDTIGVLSTEGMATGNTVLTSYFADYIKLPLPCPVINSNRSNIYENLKKAICDLDFRLKCAREGRVYVENHNDIAKIITRELNFLYNTDNQKFDFYPTFYKRFNNTKESIKNRKAMDIANQ